MSEKLILVLSQHRTFGWKFNIYSAQLLESGSLQILGIPTPSIEEKKGASAEELEIIRLIEEISDQSLMKNYSKKKSTVDFKNDLSKDTLNNIIRPRIEICNRKVAELVKKTSIPLYLRESLTSKVLYERFRIQILSDPTHCLFHFIRDEKGLRYFITLTNNEREITLQNKECIVLSDKPAIIVLDQELHFVENIDSKKFSPFAEKEYISVPPASEAMYIKDFILKTMQKYEVKIEGLGNKLIEPSKQAILVLEKDFNGDLCLILFFQYGKQRISAHLKKKKVVSLDDNKENPGICWFDRDIEWENSLIDILQQKGFIFKEGNHLHLSDHPEATRYNLIEWLNSNQDIQKYFTLEQNTENIYYTGEIEMQSQLDTEIDWFDIDIKIIIGEYKIPFYSFRKYILTGTNEYTLPDKSIFILPEEWFHQYYDLFLNSKDTEKGIQVKKIHMGVLENIISKNFSKKEVESFLKLKEISVTHPVPSVKLGKLLRPYQKTGFYWLEHLHRNGFGGCLADDMGLGKTLQTITLLEYLYKNSEHQTKNQQSGQLSLFTEQESVLKASLVIAPTSLLHNWQNELKRFAPGLKTYIYSGTKRLKTKDIGRIFDHYQVIISSYGMVRNDIDFLKEYDFHYLILDESQYIKNPESLLYQSVKQLNASHKLVLTGTPIENSLTDLWAQFNFINEGLLGNYSQFKKNYVQKIIKEQDKEREEALLKLIRPFLLRRTKEEVTPELPPLTQEIIYCDMSEAQETVYKSEKNSIRNSLLETKEKPEKENRNFIALHGLNRLRQLANHPLLIKPEYEGDSGKFEQIIMSFETLKASGHKVLIFSSYVTHLQLLEKKFKAEGWKYAMLTGQTQDREKEIEKFTKSKDTYCFFISLKAGGTGLNLTVADYVFIIDPWWNPAAEMQALSRAHRIGQQQKVMAYRFISSNTIEEKILKLQEQKSELSSTFITSNNPLDNLNMKEIEELLS